MTRILSGLVLLLVVVGVVVFAPAWATLAFALVALVLATWEFCAVADPDAGVSRIAVSAFAVVVCVTVAFGLSPVAPMVAGLVTVGALAIGRGRPEPRVPQQVGVALAAPVYLGVPIGAMVALRMEGGGLVLLAGLLTVMVSDVAQLYGGRTFGRHLLAPVVSPKKTIEGAVSGLVAGTAVLPLLGSWWLPDVGWGYLAVLGLVMSLLGIAGDLFESLLKRSAGVKDSSGLIPGHGGMLDRIDALLFAMPVFHVVLAWLRALPR